MSENTTAVAELDQVAAESVVDESVEETTENTAAPKRARRKAERKAAQGKAKAAKAGKTAEKPAKKLAGGKGKVEKADAKPAKKAGKKKVKAAKSSDEPKAERKPREKKEGLRRFQIRTLLVLRGAGSPKTLADIAAKAGISAALVVQGVGRIEEEARSAYEAKAGFPSLLTLKFVRHGENTEGRAAAYEITAAGRKAIEKYVEANGKSLPPVHVGPNGKKD